MLKKSLFLFLLSLSVLILAGCGQTGGNQSVESSSVDLGADRIEVVHFHATQQCWSCITVGELALKTIQEKFPEEYKNGLIVFKDINGELPENKNIVIKYQASGSSLFINAITNGSDNIQEDTTVWRYVSNETQFINYLENILKTLLGK
ncbi:MAG: nitrophenyl compound nitroreductase subunit ArsF family protein [Patescibacteria group bacterium]